MIVEGIIHEQGDRPHMEDTHCIEESKHWAAYAVFDGHGGGEIARHLVDKDKGLCVHLLRQLEEQYPKGIFSSQKPLAPERQREITSLLQAFFPYYDIQQLRPVYADKAVGSTACLILVTKPLRLMWICNLGDSRATVFLSDSGGYRLHFMTLDHKPEIRDERVRIESAGGMVTEVGSDVPRINDLTSVSRGFGDFHLKPLGQDFLMSNVPSVYFFDHLQPSFLVLATDGVWDEVSIAQLTHLLQQYPHSFCRRLVNQILKRQPHADNITVLGLQITNQKRQRKTV